MNVASHYLHKGDINGVRRTLEQFESNEQLAELRGFAWHYHHAAIAPFLQVSNQGDPVVDVAVFPGGRFYAACSRNREIRVWEAKTGNLIRTLSLETGRFRAVSVSPANSHLASGSTDGYVRIWNPLEHDRPTHQIKHGPPVTIVRYAASGKRLLSAGHHGAVRIWDATTGEMTQQIPTGMNGTKAVRFSPDGTKVAIATEDGLVRLRDVETGSIESILESSTLIESLAYSDDGKILVTGSYEGRVEIWSVEEGDLLFSHDTSLGVIGDMEFFKGTRLLALPTVSGELVIFDSKAGQEIRRIVTHNLTKGIVDRSADGRVLAVGSGGGSVKLLDVSMLSKPNLFWHKKSVEPGQVSPTGISIENPLRSVVFSPNNRQLLAASADGRVASWNVEEGTSVSLKAPTPEDRLLLMATDEANQFLALVHHQSGVTVSTLQSEKLGEPISLSGSHTTAAEFSPTGNLLALGNRTGRLTVFDSSDWNTTVLEKTMVKSRINTLQFSSDGSRMAIGYQNGTLQILDCTEWEPQSEEISLSSVPLTLTFCRQGTILAVGTESGEIQLRQADGGALEQIIQAHASRVNVVTRFPDGKILVSGGRDKHVNLWHAESGELITTLYGHRRQILSIAVSPDSKTISSGGLIGEIRIWRSIAP